MSRKVLTLICLISFIDIGYLASVPITKCHSSDSKCLTSSSQAIIPIFAKGLPEYGVESLDPAVFKKPIDASANGLKFIITDFVLTGLKDCIMKKLTRDVPNGKIMGNLLCDVTGNGQYEMEGNLLVLKVQGQGNLRVVLRKLFISLEADVADKIGKDGKHYWDLKRFTHSFELQDKADLVFENLFSGSDVLGRAANQVIESSSNEIVLEIGPRVIEVITTKVVENIDRFLNKIPVEEHTLI